MNRLFPALLVALAATPAVGEYVLWDYSMQSCPPGWNADQYWSFVSSGAFCSIAVDQWSTWYISTMDSGTNDVMIPAGTDSVVLEATQILLVDSWPEAWTGYHFWVNYRVNVGSWIRLWSFEGPPPTYFEDYVPLHCVVPVAPLSTVGIQFHAYVHSVNTSEGMCSINWDVGDLTLKAYGEGFDLDQGSWGTVKALFQI